MTCHGRAQQTQTCSNTLAFYQPWIASLLQDLQTISNARVWKGFAPMELPHNVYLDLLASVSKLREISYFKYEP